MVFVYKVSRANQYNYLYIKISLIIYYLCFVCNIQSKIIISEQHKLSFCMIRKSASSQMQKLMYSILLNEEDKRCGSDCKVGTQIDLEMHKKNFVIPNYPAQILDNNKWTHMVIIRDPLERLLSGFLHWCIKVKTPRQCPKDVQQSQSFELFVNDVIRNYSINGCDINYHWRPSTCYCNLKYKYDKFNAKLFYTRDTIGKQVFNVLKRKGLDRFYYGYGNNRNETLFEVLPGHATKASDKVNQYFTKNIIKKAMEIYKEDYRVFQLEYPQWALSILHNKTNQTNQATNVDSIYNVQMQLIPSMYILWSVVLMFIVWISYQVISRMKKKNFEKFISFSSTFQQS